MVTKWSSSDEFAAILSDLLGFQSIKTPSDKAMQASSTSSEEFCNLQNVNCTLYNGSGTTATQHRQAVPRKETCVTGIDFWKTNSTYPVQVRENNNKLDPVGSTVRYEMMKLCTGPL